MAAFDEISKIELRRLRELEAQRAYSGINTEPSILLEIADLRAKYGSSAVAVSKETGPHLQASVSNFADELDFVRTLCASALRKIDDVEQRRFSDVLWRNIWLGALTLGLILVLIRVY